MENYYRLVEKYVGSLRDGVSLKVVMGRFNRVKMPNDTRAIIRHTILHKYYGTSAKKFIQSEVAKEHAESVTTIVTRIKGYSEDRFNLAIAVVNNSIEKPARYVRELMAFLDECNPNDYTKALNDIFTADANETREILTGIESSVYVTCSICREIKRLNEMEFGSSSCSECRKKQRNGIATTGAKYNKTKEKEAKLAEIDRFVSGGTNKSSTSTDEIRLRIHRINAARTFYIQLCNNLTEEVTLDTSDDRLDKLELMNKMIAEVIK